MAVEAVVAVVLQKLTDLLIHDSIALDNFIDQVEDIRLQLRLMRGFLIDAELSREPEATEWAAKYLRLLFSVEDEIENYVLSLAARGRRNIGFFQRRGFTLFAAYYDRFGAGRLLRRNLDDLATKITVLTCERPGQVVDASLRAGSHNSDDQVETGPGKSTTASAFGRSQSDRLHPDIPRSHSPVNRERLKSTKTLPSNGGVNIIVPFESPSPRRSSRSPRSSPRHLRHPKLTTTYPDQEGPDLIGFTKDLGKLAERLKEIPAGGGGGVIPVLGPTGSGKTTLVQTIYNRRDIKTHFDCRAWVHASEDRIAISQTLANILQQVLKSKEGGIPNADQLSTRVYDSLKDKTYLIVLDHVREVEFWNLLKPAFPHLDNGVSKVILITRDEKLATFIIKQENSYPHRLNRLCDEHSWGLFTKKSCLDQDNGQLDDASRYEILKKCRGCPLDIVMLGGLLSTKGPSCDEWKRYLSQASWRKMEILPLSYNDLPVHSKLCLLYMALFPNEVDISVRRLHRLWLAEGFVRRSPVMSEEEIVEECFDDLVQRNLVKISKFRSDGSPRRCRLPRALREYLSLKAHDISLFYIHQASVSPYPGVRRVVEYVDIKNYSPASTSGASLSPFHENLRSYLSFNFQRNDTPAKEVGNFISKIIGNKGFGMLRVLDLEGVYKPTLPETLKQLFHLRYLGLRWTFIDHLPKSVGDLPYLETLDLKRTYINSLPSSVWKLEHLRHLNLPAIRLDYKQKNRHTFLTELRTLVGLIVDDETPVKEGLSQLCELRELGITCQLSSSEYLISWIKNLTNLGSLWLKSKDKMGRPSKINLEPLSKLTQLSRVSLLGNLGQLPTKNDFPPNLRVLALSVSQLNDDPMTVLSKLPSLSVLRLLADSYVGEKIECPRDGFKNLRVLKLWMLKELVEWTVGEGCMPCLKELNIRYCRKLKQLPSQLLLQDTLEELTLTAMPKEFVEQVKQVKKGHTMLTLNDYKFTPLPWENDPDLWKEPSAGEQLDDVAN